MVAKNEQQYHEIGTRTLDHSVGIGDIGSESSGISLVVNTKDW